MNRDDRATAESSKLARVEVKEMDPMKALEEEQLENPKPRNIGSLRNGIWLHEYQCQLRTCR